MKERANEEIRDLLKETGVKQWELAYEIGINESTLCRNLRFELSDKQKDVVISIIKALAEKKKEN